jgi:hypothetical protein
VASLNLMITSINRVSGASVVTRNVSDFEVCGVEIVEPLVGSRLIADSAEAS